MSGFGDQPLTGHLSGTGPTDGDRESSRTEPREKVRLDWTFQTT